MRISFEEVKAVLQEKLTDHGCPEEKARIVAYEMARNSLEGTYTHGINRFARLIKNIDEKSTDVHAEPEITGGFGGLEQADGHLGLGIINARFCMNRAIELAKVHGIGGVALRNTNHWLRAATYGHQACEAGMAGICFTNTMPNMPTWGAVDSRLGNNPLVFAFPRKEGNLVVDMAMSQFSYGALELARLENRQMPIDAGYDLEGNLTKNPDDVIRSRRILPTGYWKGAALSFILDVFAAGISGGNNTCEIGKMPGDEQGVSQFFLAVNYQALVSEEEAEKIVNGAVENLLASEKDSHTQRIVYAGQKAVEVRAENLKLGIPVEQGVWEKILSL